jgi:tetratricopeptide (TPR) repeat protein
MKKVLTLLYVLFFACNVSGQQIVDDILKARALTEAGKPYIAIDILNTAIEIKNDSRLYIERAEASFAKGDYSAAINDFNNANKITSFSGEFGLSRMYALKRDAATSLYHLEMNISSVFRKSKKDILLNPAFRSIENTQEWRQFWKNNWYSLTEKSISEIEYYISAGKITEAKEILSNLKNNYQSSDEIIFAEALINYSSGNYSEVKKHISRLITGDKSNEKYLRIMAKAQSAESNPAGASVTYTKLINLGIADAELLVLRAKCYSKTGEIDKALSDVEKYLKYYPEDRTALSIAGSLEILSGDNLKGLKYFTENLKLHPDDPECYIDRANSYFGSKSWSWAINDYSMSLDLKPGDANTWLKKGIALLKIGKLEDACHDFRKSFSLGNKRASEFISRNCIK